MGRRKTGKWLAYALLALLACWTIAQTYGALRGDGGKESAVKLLYQVSLFQMELLNSYLQETDKVRTTGELNELKQVMYAAKYTHDHLVLAIGERELTPLPSLDQFLQVLMRLQIGGERPLKQEETRTLADARKSFAELYDAYGKLLSESDGVIGSQNARLVKSDKSLSELLKKKLTN